MKSPYDSRISWIKCNELSLPIDLEQEYGWINVEYLEKDFERIEGDLEDKKIQLLECGNPWSSNEEFIKVCLKSWMLETSNAWALELEQWKMDRI